MTRLQQQIQLAKSNIEVLELMANYIKNSSEPSRIEDFERVIDQKLANEKELLTLELMNGIENINP